MLTNKWYSNKQTYAKTSALDRIWLTKEGEGCDDSVHSDPDCNELHMKESQVNAEFNSGKRHARMSVLGLIHKLYNAKHFLSGEG